MSLIQLRSKINKLLAEHNHLTRLIQEEKHISAREKERLIDIDEARKILQEAAQQVQNVVHQKIARIVSRCLEIVFPNDPYKFKIRFERKRGKTEADLIFTRGGMELNPMKSTGGGHIQVASFALRLAALVLSQPKRRLLLCLDEPFSGVHTKNMPRIEQMLMTLSEELGVQFIIATQRTDFRCGSVIEIQK